VTGGPTTPLPPGRAHLGADQALLPGGDAGEVELLDGLAAEVEVQALGGDGELESHGLVSLRHAGGPPAPAEGHGGC